MILFELLSTGEKIRLNTFSKHDENLMEIMLPDNSVLEGKDLSKGFKITYMGNIIDCSNFTTRYDILSNTYKQAFFSNDGSTETPDNKIKYIVKKLKPVQPSEDEIQEAKDFAISRSKASLQKFLSIPFVSYAHNNTKGYYTVTLEKQNLMMNKYLNYTIQKQTNKEATVYWNEKDEPCTEWTGEEFERFVKEVTEYIEPAINYQQNLEKTIRSYTTLEEIESVNIDYNQFLVKEE